jgi:hypothetical protein
MTAANIDRYFVGMGSLVGIVGLVLGIAMGMSEDFSLAPVHAHINLVGWIPMVLFGLAYRSGLARKDRAAVVHFWTAAAGAVLFPVGLYVAITRQQPALAIVGSLLTLASLVLFLVNCLRQSETPKAHS